MTLDLKFYLALFLRRIWLFLLVFVGVSAAAVSLAMLLPTVYSSNATLLVESPQIPDELAASTVRTNAAEQMQVMQQRLMTRSNLLSIARESNVFQKVSSMTPDEIVGQMRDKTRFRIASGRDRANIVEINFDARSPQIASDVVNEYITRIQDANVQQRTNQAEGTLDFFEQEVSRLAEELDTQSQRILEFQNANSGALPETLEYRLSRQSALQERQAQLIRDRSSLEDQKERLKQVFAATGSLGGASDSQTPEQRRLAQAQNELDRALAVYTESNPRVRVLRARVESLEDAVRAEAGTSGDGDQTVLDIQLAQIDARLENIDVESQRIENELAELTKTIGETPANSITLDSLRRDYRNVQQQYNSAVDRLSQAATGERIELTSKGQRISVIEQASAPSQPTSPDRPMIAAGGTAAGFGAGLALIVLIEFLNAAIRRPTDLVAGLGVTPMATIPYIRTSRQKARRWSVIALVLATVAIGIPLGLYMIHTAYLPLDLLWDRALNRLGL